MDNRIVYSQEYIIDAFFALLRVNKYDQISISDITKKAGVSRMTFYRLFKEKKDIIMAYFDRATKKYMSIQSFIINSAAYENYRLAAYHAFQMFYEEGKNVRALYDNDLIYLYLEVLNEGMKESFIQANIDSKKKYLIFSGALFNYSIEWMKSGFEMSYKEAGDDFLNQLLGIGKAE
ncbi:MAG: TetR/AcrR family transcriptional regulator [Bacilli bacterium]